MSRSQVTKRLECDVCGQLYQPEVRDLDGFPYTLCACPKCGDTLFTMEQAKAYKEVHALAELAKRELGPLTLRQVGNSVNATVPKELATIGFRKGRQFQWEVQGPGVIRMRLLSEPSSEPELPSKSSKTRGRSAGRRSAPESTGSTRESPRRRVA